MGVFRTRRTRSAGSGRFHCPSCHTDRAYELVTELEERSLLGIPLGRVRERGRRVVCQGCGTRFGPDILFGEAERVAHRVEAALRPGLRGLIVRMVLQDGRIAPEERVVLARVHRELLGEPLDDSALDAEVRAAEADGRSAGDYARTIAGYLADGEKATVLRAAMRVALADRDYAASERQLLAEIGSGLGMKTDAIRAVLEEAGDGEAKA